MSLLWKVCESCLNILVFGIAAGFHGGCKLPKGLDWLCPENPGSIMPKSSYIPSRDHILFKTCLCLDIYWIICASGRLPGSAEVFFHIPLTLNQTQCCTDPPSSLKCNYYCMTEPCYMYLASYCSFIISVLYDYASFLFISSSKEPQDSQELLCFDCNSSQRWVCSTVQSSYPCCLGTGMWSSPALDAPFPSQCTKRVYTILRSGHWKIFPEQFKWTQFPDFCHTHSLSWFHLYSQEIKASFDV